MKERKKSCGLNANLQAWQGIQWEGNNWSGAQWHQLARLLNSGQQFGCLGIHYPYLIRDSETGNWYEIPSQEMPDAHWYERAVIRSAAYDNPQRIFTIFFSWEAGFSDLRKAWIWTQPPNENGEPVNAIDFDTLSGGGIDGDRPYQPSVLQTTHGDLLRVGEDTISFPEYSYRVDPLVDVKYKGRLDGQTYGGLFIVPPDYQVKLWTNQIRFSE